MLQSCLQHLAATWHGHVDGSAGDDLLDLNVCTAAAVIKHNQWLHHHHQITKLSHSINAISPAPHRSGKKREHRSNPIISGLCSSAQ
jgi:hypothetical protein